MRGVTFAAQTFFTKLNGAIATAVSVFALTLIGFKEGEGVIQAAGFADKLWTFSCLGSIIGGSARCSSCACTNSTTMMFSSCPSARMVESTARGSEAQMINRY